MSLMSSNLAESLLFLGRKHALLTLKCSGKIQELAISTSTLQALSLKARLSLFLRSAIPKPSGPSALSLLNLVIALSASWMVKTSPYLSRVCRRSLPLLP